MKEATMDPFNPDVLGKSFYGYITQHFTGKDLLKMLEVSTSWNEIAEDQKIGDKVRLNLKLHSMTEEELQILDRSSRVYKTVTLEFDIAQRLTHVVTFVDDVLSDFECSYSFKSYKCFEKVKQQILGFKIVDHNSWLEKNLNDIEDLKLTIVYEYKPECIDYDIIHQFIAKQKNLKRMDISESHSDFRKEYEENSLIRIKQLSANIQEEKNP
jgi:hypothetical protein